MFLVMMRVTSCNSSFSLSSGELVALMFRVSWYNLAVLAMNVSTHATSAHNAVNHAYYIPKLTKAYGFRTVSTFAPYDVANSLDNSSR